MRALQILEHGAFDPDGVQRLQQAFDAAWETIAPSIEKAEHPKAREALATVVVSAGNVSDLDGGELASVAERIFAAIQAGQKSRS